MNNTVATAACIPTSRESNILLDNHFAHGNLDAIIVRRRFGGLASRSTSILGERNRRVPSSTSHLPGRRCASVVGVVMQEPRQAIGVAASSSRTASVLRLTDMSRMPLVCGTLQSSLEVLQRRRLSVSLAPTRKRQESFRREQVYLRLLICPWTRCRDLCGGIVQNLRCRSR